MHIKLAGMMLRSPFLIAGIALFGLPAGNAFAAKDDGDRGDVRIVRMLYDDFAGEAVLEEPGTRRPLLDQPKDVLARYFTQDVTSLIRQDRECAERTREICKLDFLPIWASQDPSGATVWIVGDSTPGKVVATVHYPNGENIKLIFRVGRTPAGWRVADITYADSSESLLRILGVGN